MVGSELERYGTYVCGMICGAITAYLWRDRGSSQKIYVKINCL
jgi:hypothetical protein